MNPPRPQAGVPAGKGREVFGSIISNRQTEASRYLHFLASGPAPEDILCLNAEIPGESNTNQCQIQRLQMTLSDETACQNCSFLSHKWKIGQQLNFRAERAPL